MKNEQEIKANTFNRIIEFLQEKTEVQNIDLMMNAGFCRNCIAKWYKQEAQKLGVSIDIQEAKNIIYNMPYHKWKQLYQKDVDEDKMKSFQASQNYKEKK